MLHFNGFAPQELYCNFLKRCLKKAEKLASGAKTFKGRKARDRSLRSLFVII